MWTKLRTLKHAERLSFRKELAAAAGVKLGKVTIERIKQLASSKDAGHQSDDGLQVCPS